MNSKGNHRKSHWLGLTLAIAGVVGGTPMGLRAQLPPNPEKKTSDAEQPMLQSPELPPTNEPVVPTPEFPGSTPKIEEAPLFNPWKNVRLIRTILGHSAAVASMVFSPDSSILMSGGSRNDPALKLWSVNTGEELDRIRIQRATVSALVMSPNGRTLISSGHDSAINLWDWNTNLSKKPYTATFLDNQSYVLALAVTPDSQVLVSGALDGIKVWTLNPQRPLYQMVDFGYPTYALAIEPNGYILVSGDNKGKVRFWNLREGKLISEFSPHQEAITGLAVTPDGSRLITSSEDRTIKVWDLASKKLVHTLIGHTARVRAIALHPNGYTLASGSNDGVRLWDLSTGELLTQMSEHKDWISSLAFSRDGRLLATGGFDSTIRIWETSPYPVRPQTGNTSLNP
jgi:COMPASS component SWD3